MDANRTIPYCLYASIEALKQFLLFKLHLFIIIISFSTNIIFGQEYDTLTKITIQAENQTIESILSDITQQSGLNFSFNSNVLDTKEKITFKVSGRSIKGVLNDLSRQLNLDYKIIEDQIILKKPKKLNPTKKISH